MGLKWKVLSQPEGALSLEPFALQWLGAVEWPTRATLPAVNMEDEGMGCDLGQLVGAGKDKEARQAPAAATTSSKISEPCTHFQMLTDTK